VQRRRYLAREITAYFTIQQYLHLTTCIRHIFLTTFADFRYVKFILHCNYTPND